MIRVESRSSKVGRTCFEICYLRIVAQPPQVAQRLARDAEEAHSRCDNIIHLAQQQWKLAPAGRRRTRVAPSLVRRWLARCSRKVAESHSMYMATRAHRFCHTRHAVLTSRLQAVTLPQHTSHRSQSCGWCYLHPRAAGQANATARLSLYSTVRTHLAFCLLSASNAPARSSLVFVLETSGTSAAPALTCRDLHARDLVTVEATMTCGSREW